MDMSLTYVTFMSYFLVPIIGVKIYSSRHNQTLRFSIETLYMYVLLTVLNLPLTRVVISVFQRILGIQVYEGTMKYIVLAIVSSIVLPVIIELFEKAIRVDVEVEKKEKEDNENEENDE